MPDRLIDDQGRAVLVAGEIAKAGGEGRILEVQGRPDLVAKLYHSGVAEPEKLRAMIAARSDALLEIAAWPVSTLRERAEGPPVGFLMPRFVGCQEIHNFYFPDNRLKLYPNANWKTLARAAINLAAVFRVVHEHGFVIGDVNQKNILIDNNQAVCLVDCDSFQVRANGRVYRCGVGVPEFTPPELQGQNLREVHRKKDHDRFGLAVMIFLMLFANRHPFGDGSNLQQFVYTRNNSRRRSSSPPGALSLDAVPFSLAQLFERAFAPPGQGARPTAAEWESALTDFHNQLVPCRLVKTHYYHPVANRCPWCRLEAKYSVRLFRNGPFPAPQKLQPRPVRSRLPFQGAACFLIVLLSLGAGILAIGHRPSAVVPGRADGALRRVPVVESQEETTRRIVLELVTSLHGDHADDVHRSLQTLNAMGPAAAPAVPRLTKFLLQNEPIYRASIMLKIQSWALEVLQGIDPNWLSSNQCEELVARLRDQLERSRPGNGRTPYVTEPSEAQAAAALGLLGPAARRAIPELILTCASDDDQARERAREALKRIDPDWPKSAEAKRCVPRLVEIWSSLPNSFARGDASITLHRIEPDWFANHLQRRGR